ncbi:hypothetical protein NECAME_14935 [Necator americanus]|uniref:Uncharacterized protein n=1 Tax=Necator americanus TaxID=51031 RepID=W2SMS1_NECAM|nr:hypothetical protein NECAME_14935 [Necator americanus]ETN70161.1 hypothetical protein NECAME_14935 [Necator americanus]
MMLGFRVFILALLGCYSSIIGSSEGTTTTFPQSGAHTTATDFSSLDDNYENENKALNYTPMEAFPGHIKSAFFISAATTLCVLLSCSFLIGLYEVYDKKKQKPVKSHA